MPFIGWIYCDGGVHMVCANRRHHVLVMLHWSPNVNLFWEIEGTPICLCKYIFGKLEVTRSFFFSCELLKFNWNYFVWDFACSSTSLKIWFKTVCLCVFTIRMCRRLFCSVPAVFVFFFSSLTCCWRLSLRLDGPSIIARYQTFVVSLFLRLDSPWSLLSTVCCLSHWSDDLETDW